MPSLASRGITSQAGPSRQTAEWRGLLVGSAWAAVVTAILIPFQIVIFVAYPFPETVEGWFDLLQDSPLAGLVDLDLLLVVVNVLLIVIILCLYLVLRTVNPSVTTVAVGLSLLSIVIYVLINPAIQMLALSDQFAVATSDAQRLTTLAAGEGVMAAWEGTAFHVAYVVGQIAGILIGLVMLRTSFFGKAVPYTLIVGNALGFGYYLPRVGLTISALAGAVLWVWYILIVPKLFHLARMDDVSGEGT